jgi:hypothetical protein
MRRLAKMCIFFFKLYAESKIVSRFSVCNPRLNHTRKQAFHTPNVVLLESIIFIEDQYVVCVYVKFNEDK